MGFKGIYKKLRLWTKSFGKWATRLWFIGLPIAAVCLIVERNDPQFVRMWFYIMLPLILFGLVEILHDWMKCGQQQVMTRKNA